MAAPVGLAKVRVVDAGVAVLEDTGRVADVALREVAARLGIRVQSLYAHVDGVEGLRRELALRGLAALEARLTEAAIGRAGRAAVEAIVRAYLDFADRHPGLYEAALRPPGQDPQVRAGIDAVMRPLNLVFGEYGLSAAAAVHWYRIVFAEVHGLAVLRRDGLITLPGDLDATVERMVGAVVAGLEAEGTGRRARRR